MVPSNRKVIICGDAAADDGDDGDVILTWKQKIMKVATGYNKFTPGAPVQATNLRIWPTWVIAGARAALKIAV